MTSLLKRNGPKFHCSNCMMEVRPQEGQLPICCGFCGYVFSNWSSIIIDSIIDEEKLHITGDDTCGINNEKRLDGKID